MSDHDNIMDTFDKLFYQYWCYTGYENLIHDGGDLRFAFHMFCMAFSEYRTHFNTPSNEIADTSHFKKQAMLQNKILPHFLDFMRLPVNQSYYNKKCFISKGYDLYDRCEKDLMRRVESYCITHEVEFTLDVTKLHLRWPSMLDKEEN